MIGYLQNNLWRYGEKELFMLPGLGSNMNAFRIGGLSISRLEYGDMQAIEKSQFMDDLADSFANGKSPLFCVFGSSSRSEKEDRSMTGFRRLSVFRLAQAFWLLKGGVIFNPLDFVHYQSRGSLNIRDPGLFGRLGFEIGDTYTVEQSELPYLEAIYYLLELYDRARHCAPLDLSKFLFTETFSPAWIEPTDKMLLLLSALACIGGDNLEPLRRATWLDASQGELLGRLKSTRNTLAHGKQSAGANDVETLRDLVRLLLRESLFWCCTEAGVREPFGRGLLERVAGLDSVSPVRLVGCSVAYDSMAWLSPLPPQNS